MHDFRRFVRRELGPLGLPSDREQKIVDEWAAQLEDIYDALRADGLSDEEAWLELQRQLPDKHVLGRDLVDAEPPLSRIANPERGPFAGRTARAVVSTMRERWTAGLLHDVRTGVRRFVRDPGFSATVVLTLAICLGANAAIFTVVNTVLLQPLPVPEPHRIVGFGDVYPTVTPNDILSNDAPSYFDRLEALTTLEDQGLFTFWYDTVQIDRIAHELRGMRATPSLFRVVRVQRDLGRTFTD
jgi:hypothetical protein